MNAGRGRILLGCCVVDLAIESTGKIKRPHLFILLIILPQNTAHCVSVTKGQGLYNSVHRHSRGGGSITRTKLKLIIPLMLTQHSDEQDSPIYIDIDLCFNIPSEGFGTQNTTRSISIQFNSNNNNNAKIKSIQFN